MNALIEQIPDKISDTEVLDFLRNQEVNSEYVKVMKEFTSLPDQVLSQWFNINVKTFRTLKNPSAVLKENMKEQIILLLSLFKHGLEVFGSIQDFKTWLSRDNFYMDSGKPIEFINTITGMRFIEDRLTAMEYGDNV